MADKKRTIRFQQVIDVPPHAVYEAFTTAATITDWLCTVAQVKPHINGRVYFWWSGGYYASGEFTLLKPAKKITFSWHGRGEPGITTVNIKLKPVEGGTALTLTHQNLGRGKKWEQAVKEFRKGWEDALENLKSVLESGVDLRLLRKPLLGITSASILTPGEAESSGQQTLAGIKIGSVAEGLAADSAGLRSGDVLVKMDGVRLYDFNSLSNVLSQHKAGDKVKVVFYRGEKKHSKKLKLSTRPIPQVPTTPTELATAIQKNNEILELELRRLLRGVKEAEADFKPEPGEWSAKEIVAHLIATERDAHTWILDILEGFAREPIYHDNLPQRTQAFLASYSDLKALRVEFSRALTQTASLIASFPPEFEYRKGSLWRLGVTLLDTPEHTREHFEQIKNMISSARNAQQESTEPDQPVSPDEELTATEKQA